MRLYIKNIEYFEWEVPDEVEDMLKNGKSEQDIVDEFFEPTDISVAKISDDYYEETQDR